MKSSVARFYFVRQLGWWLIDYGYAIYGHLYAVGGLSRRRKLQSGDGQPILLVPGIIEGWYFMLPLARKLYAWGFQVHILPIRARDVQTVQETAQLIRTYILQHDLREVTIVGHSKGGLDGLAALKLTDMPQRITRLIAVAAPFNGTIFAYHVKARLVRQFLPGGETVQAAALVIADRAKIFSLSPCWDNHVWHPLGSFLPQASNIMLPVPGHHRIIFSKVLVDEICAIMGRTKV